MGPDETQRIREERSVQPTRLTVMIEPRTNRALDMLEKVTGDSGTVSINRAIQLYLWVSQQLEAGHCLALIEKDSDQVMSVTLL